VRAVRNPSGPRFSSTGSRSTSANSRRWGEPQVVPDRTDRVAVAIDVDRHVRMRLQSFRGLVEHGGVLRTDICLVKVKVDATQDDLLRRRRGRRWWRRWRLFLRKRASYERARNRTAESGKRDPQLIGARIRMPSCECSRNGAAGCRALVSRACSDSSRSFFHGSLVGFAAARNWSSRSLRSATNWQCCVASVAAVPALRARSHTLDLAPRGLAAVPEHHGVGEAGHRGPVAPTRLPDLLALAVEAWAAISRSRGS